MFAPEIPHVNFSNVQVQNYLSQQSLSLLSQPVTPQEIDKVILSSNSDKAPGVDGLNAEFYKSCWSIIKDDVIAAILEFFRTGKILNEVNITSITLIPKKENTNSFSDYHPLSICKMIYIFISKLIANRLKVVLPDLISSTQHAFIRGRLIHENIALCHSLMHNYHLISGQKRMSIKVDLHKAYDSVRWDFLLQLLCLHGFPTMMISWIRACVSYPSFTININGSSVGFFRSSRGLRQGCPMAPFLFLIVMQHLSSRLDDLVRQGMITPHPSCANPLITHLAFADDLIIFAEASESNARGIKDVLGSFADISGQSASITKSNLYMAGCSRDLMNRVQDILGIPIGTLPTRFLGVPLITKQLTYNDCLPLIESIQSRIHSWKAKYLSYMGRLSLIKSGLQVRTCKILSAIPEGPLYELDAFQAPLVPEPTNCPSSSSSKQTMESNRPLRLQSFFLESALTREGMDLLHLKGIRVALYGSYGTVDRIVRFIYALLKVII
ncbi:hypothetical protein Cni_G09958 [Canna indica]|uniref:Reverse transcriptase domain-containing protein n=1 Tax=Canna indica TaxID=4628 RepID=A0AAQ3K3J8_9LILI|nr:hypothetical protein Cni_G09958 [Canna indica]